ncbi:alpha/beta hydrolase [Streptomyces sp. UNOC14_S4]|uniref:alpha/beta hydrolase n=1 Tax=Streptomyces sp. UNOC14_S4 TaxID=2872340 RepID=UPI001E5078DB|nr:alpha/beta fold hydrolase [Streptomyces sp. UNOC14_S4]MCC3768877.1 lysophospholipase [Streptomyces sp. UNOC14_S4]
MYPQDIHQISELTATDGTGLALHRWAPQGDARGVLFYVHGIQSHAGWLFETGPELAARGVVGYALDRRGSGLSGGGRGDLASAEALLDDYRLGLDAARREHPGLPVTVLGQSFGGSVVAGLAATGGGLDVATVVYCTPALGQQRARFGSVGLAAVRQLSGQDRAPIALEDEDYTGEARYLEFMANDRLMLRQITDRTRATMVALEDSYAELPVPVSPGADVHFVRAERDPIIDLDVSEKTLRALHADFTTTSFAARHHYIEFSPARRDYWDWLAGIAGPAGARS